MSHLWILLKILISLHLEINCHVPVNTSDVFVSYVGHSEVPNFNDNVVLKIEESDSDLNKDSKKDINNEDDIFFVPNNREPIDDYLVNNGDKRKESDNFNVNDKVKQFNNLENSGFEVGGKIPGTNQKKDDSSKPKEEEKKESDVVFIRDTVQKDAGSSKFGVSLDDIEDNLPRSVYDIMKDGDKVRVETDRPTNGDFFIKGKNDEKTHELEPKKVKKTERHRVETRPPTKLNCRSLNCNNTVNSICGGKFENNRWRYRLFLNECFFRKVNCAFRFEINRYEQVAVENCDNIGLHQAKRVNEYTFYMPVKENTRVDRYEKTRRDFSARRSSNLNLNGNLCGHSCPVICPEDYLPECAISSRGEKKVFMNHCQLDYNSCFYRIEWQRKQLSECIGHRKAEIRENRAFIGWMQKVGIIDSKGRLVSQ